MLAYTGVTLHGVVSPELEGFGVRGARLLSLPAMALLAAMDALRFVPTNSAIVKVFKSTLWQDPKVGNP